MFSTRKEVDEHVHKLFNKIPTGRERDLKSLAIGRMYYKIHEYAKAIEYLTAYLKVNEDAASHKFIGDCYKLMKKPDHLKVLEHFQRSIQLNPNQSDVITESCQILYDQKALCSKERAAYWLGLAAKCSNLANNEMISELRMRCECGTVGGGPEECSIELLLHRELMMRPNDVVLCARLLRNYLDEKRICEAFKYAYKIELQMPAQCQSSDWYDIVWAVLSKCGQSKEIPKDWRYWQLLLITLDRRIQLSLQSESSGSLADSITKLFKLDQYIYKFSLISDQLSINGEDKLHDCCLEHYTGQLLLHAATLLFKRELLSNKNKWSSTVQTTLPLLLLGYQQSSLNVHSPHWQHHCNSEQQKLLELWRYQTAFRCAQLGRTLHGCLPMDSHDDVGNNNLHHNQTQNFCLTSSDDILSMIRQRCTVSQWRYQLYQNLYTNTEQKLKEQSSHLVRYPRLQEPLYEWPTLAEIEAHEQKALLLPAQTLEQHVYLALGTDNLSEVPRVRFYKNMRRDYKKSLSYCAPESLSQLDVDLFLYAVVLQAQRRLQIQRENYHTSSLGNHKEDARPLMLPFAIMMRGGELISAEQYNWWTIVQNLYNNSHTTNGNLIAQREQLQSGLEAVRGVNGIHAEMIIIFKLGKLLDTRPDRAHLETRIETLYKLGVNMMRRHQQHQLEPFYRYFNYTNANGSGVWLETQQLAEEAITYLSIRAFKRSHYEDFLDEVRGLKLPMAVYLQAESYRQLADSNRTSRVARQNFQDRRLDCLRQTKTLLVSYPDHPLISVLQRELKDAELKANDCHSSPDLHNNSSAYEDAEDDFYAGAAQFLNRSHNRSRRQADSQSSINMELEQTIKQISKQLCVLKEDVSGGMEAMHHDIKTLTERFVTIEEMLKKCKISRGGNSETPTRDVDTAAAAPLAWDDLLCMEDPLASNYLNGVQSTSNTPERFYAPVGGALHSNAAYGNPMYNHNPMYNYIAAQAHLMRTAPVQGTMPPAFFGSRATANYGMPPHMYPNPGNAPFIEGLNYGIAATPPSLVMPQVSQAGSMPLNQPTVPSNVPLAPVAGFFNSATFVPTPNPVSQASQMPTPVRTPLVPQKPISTTAVTAVIAPVPASVTAPVLPSVAVAPVITSPAVFNRELNNQPVEKEPPANVVITSSDPLPKPAVSSAQPTFSVTIPPQHIKPSLVPVIEPPAVVSSDFNFSIGNNNYGVSNAFSGVVSSTFSFKTQVAQAAAEKQKELAAETANNESASSEPNQGADTSADQDYDPRPDFQGIIPLPDEVEVRTGEENEEIKFSYRARLYRHIDKEWKERGTGIIKILRNQSVGSTRLLMRREQTHKICANHKIIAGMTLTTPDQDKEGKSFLWVANDFADEKLQLEKFLVRFKLAETAKEFKSAFEEAAANEAARSEQEPPPIFGIPKTNAINSFVTSTPAANQITKQIEPVAKVEPLPDPVAAKSLFGNLASNLSGASNGAAPSPFANFSFGSAPNAAKTSAVNLSFGSLSALPDTSISNTAYTTAFNFGSTLLNKTQPQDVQTANGVKTLDKTAEKDEEYVPTAQFEPVIPLPELIKVVTGEENEIVLFEHRARLLRFDKSINEWKERGVGNIKLLQLKTNPSQVRLIMRREQVLKLCCNQHLQPDTKFSYAKNSQNALTWAGQDYSEQELTTEFLCVRFKTADICKQFYDAVLKAQDVMLKQTADAKPETPIQQLDKKADADANTKQKTHGFGDAFKPKAGSWNCQGCYTTNDAKQLYCVACETPKDDTVPPKPPTLDQSGALNLSSSFGKFSFGFAPSTTTTGNFSFGAKTATEKVPPQVDPPGDAIQTKMDVSASAASNVIGFGEAFKPKAGSWSCKDCYTSNGAALLYCAACQAPKDDTVPKTNITLGEINALNLPVAPNKFMFNFGAVAPATSTGDSLVFKPASTATFSGFGEDTISTAVPNNKNEGNTFGSTSFSFKPAATSTNSSSLNSNKFSFSMPKTQQQPKSPATNIGGSNVINDDDSHVEEEENNAYFAPVIPLPDKIEVKTGEEDEDLLYVQRAKLFRLTEEGEWKERGLGNVKIRRQRETKNLRVVMRREKVLKICLNHVLSSSVVYKPKDEKTWLFVVHDFSEGETLLERFALRFKNADVAQAFLTAVKCALNGNAEPINEEENQPQQLVTDASTKSTDESISSNQILAVQPALTSELNCIGCRGCEPEKFNYGLPAKPEEDEKPPLPMTLPVLKLPSPNLKEQLKLQEIPSSFNRSLLKASTLVASSTANCGSLNIADTTVPPPQQTENKSSGFLFGSAEKPIFGQSASLFGGYATTNPQQSIFGGGIASDKCRNQNESIFGSSAKPPVGNPEETTKSIFNPTIFGGNTTNTGNSLSGFAFGSATATSAAPTFGNQAKEDKTISFADMMNSKEAEKGNKANIDEPISTASESGGISTPDHKTAAGNCFSELGAKAGDDFASLAAKGTSNPIGFQKSSSGGFFGLTHQDDFKNFKSPGTTKLTASGEDSNTDAGDENYDPHYEPIIALPSEIVVSTGEENETKLFCERVMLFRYDSDSKEWKERGVGELKILKHNTLNSYRMLMRREQIFKLVLNMKIGTGFTFDFMNDQKKSFVWANFNYAESPDGVLERLACRFKKQELADKFQETLQRCIKESKAKEEPEDGPQKSG